MLIGIINFHISGTDIISPLLFCSLRIDRLALNMSALFQILIDLSLFLVLIDDPSIVATTDLDLVAQRGLEFTHITIGIICRCHLLDKICHLFVINTHLIVIIHGQPGLYHFTGQFKRILLSKGIGDTRSIIRIYRVHTGIELRIVTADGRIFIMIVQLHRRLTVFHRLCHQI